MDGNWANTEHLPLPPTFDLKEMGEEIERLRREFGLRPVRIEVGRAMLSALLRASSRLESGPLPTFAGTPVMLSERLEPDEWSLVFRGRRT